ncbi:FimD/PapC N-terminal domain-containing protein [Enterobacter cloacae]|nr:FimD/PapC N-terminal domain-containing protein [Enterobacter cloacae]
MNISPCKTGALAFCLSAVAFGIRAEILPTAAPTMELARAFFDTQALKENGLDPAIADYYAVAPRFMPGYHNVTVLINGKKRGIMPVKFNDEGLPCIDGEFLDAAGLYKKLKRETCPSIHQYWKNATVVTSPDVDEISLVVPPEAINPESGRQVADVRGGRAAMLN